MSFSSGLVSRLSGWLQPHSTDPDTAFRERTIRLVASSGVLLLALTLGASLFIFHDHWTLVSYPTLFAVTLLFAASAALLVNRERVLTAGWLLVLAWVLASVGVVVMGRGYAAGQGVTALMLSLVIASVVLPRSSILPIGIFCIFLSAGITILSYAVGAIADPTQVGPFGGILTNSVVFVAEVLLLYERAKESDDRLEAMQKLFAEAEKARHEADQANRAKSQFLANMSHELRTPLNAVTGYTDIMLGGMAGDFTDSQREMLGYIHGSGKRLLVLINDVLDLARIEAGRLEVFFTLASPQQVVGDVTASMQSLAQQKNSL